MERRSVIIAVLAVLGIGLLIWGVNSTRKREAVLQKEQPKAAVTSQADEKNTSPEIQDLSQLDMLIEKGDEDAFKKGVESARKLTEENKLIEARNIYTKLIQSFPAHPDISGIEKKLWALNMKILFSPLKTDYSTIYEVKSGDTLTAIAKKFNTTVGLLKKSNGLNSNLIRIGRRLKVVTAKVSIIVDKSQNILTLKINDEIIKVYPCSTGEFNITPLGKFKIENKLVNPVWFKTGAVVPPESPENILGTRWMGFNSSGYGIHGTTEPESIGKQITAGCIRMYNKDVEELYDIVPVGTEVTIID